MVLLYIQQQCNATVIDVFSKGQFRSMLWIKFDSMCVRDRVVSTLSKSRLSFDSAAIWMSGNAPLLVRVEKKFLFGLKRLLQSWGCQIFEILIDIAGKSLSIDNHTVVRVLAKDTNCFVKFEKPWHDRLKDDALTALCQNCKRAMSERKVGKGAGKSWCRQRCMDVVSPVPNFVQSTFANHNSTWFSNSFAPTMHSSGINVGTWNVEGITDDKLICLIRSMRFYRIQVFCITETHMEHSFQLRTDDGYLVFYSGTNIESPSHSGVGFIVAPSTISTIIGCRPISNRICSLKLRVTHGVIWILCAYAPHNSNVLVLKQQFFESLQDAYISLTMNGPKMIFGDLNARLHYCIANEHHILSQIALEIVLLLLVHQTIVYFWWRRVNPSIYAFPTLCSTTLINY